MLHLRNHDFDGPACQTAFHNHVGLRMKGDGIQEVKCRCTLHGFKDPDVLDLVSDRTTESSALSAALILQLIASCRFVLTIGDVTAAFLLADKEAMPKSSVKEGLHPDPLFEVKGRCKLKDQPQQVVEDF